MNKRGQQEGYQIIIELVIIGIIFALLYQQATKLDVGYIQRTLTAKDLALTLSTISFLPGNFYYEYLTDADKPRTKWPEFPAELRGSTIAYYNPEKPELPPNLYSVPFKITTNKETFTLAQNSLQIQKDNVLELNGKSYPHMLPCNEKRFEGYMLHPDKGGEEGKYYNQEGNLIEGIPEEDYEGFNVTFYIDGEQVWKGNPGEKIGEQYEKDITYDIAKRTGLTLTRNENQYVDYENLPEKTIILATGKGKFAVAFIPLNLSYYNEICTLLNKMALNEEIEGTAIVPADVKHITIIIGRELERDTVAEAFK